MKFILTLCFVFMLVSGMSQTVRINKVDLQGSKVVVYYDLEDANTTHEYLLNLYSSNDNYVNALKNVTGDIGPEVKPGTNKKVEWDIRKEYGGFKGKIALELKGKVYSPFVKLESFSTNKSYKRGKTYNINWKAGASNPIHIELYKGDLRLDGAMNQPNNGVYTLIIPPKSKPGKDYRLKISDAKNNDEVVYTPLFKVVPKVPLLLKALVPIAVVGGVIAVLGSGGGGGENPGGNNNPTEIPAPILPGG